MGPFGPSTIFSGPPGSTVASRCPPPPAGSCRSSKRDRPPAGRAHERAHAAGPPTLIRTACSSAARTEIHIIFFVFYIDGSFRKGSRRPLHIKSTVAYMDCIAGTGGGRLRPIILAPPYINSLADLAPWSLPHIVWTRIYIISARVYIDRLRIYMDTPAPSDGRGSIYIQSSGNYGSGPESSGEGSRNYIRRGTK